jgi:hypothetical protein
MSAKHRFPAQPFSRDPERPAVNAKLRNAAREFYYWIIARVA